MNTEPKLESLVALYIEGKCGSEELDELSALLLEDADNRRYFLEMVLLDRDLEILGGTGQRGVGISPFPVELVLQRQRRRTVRNALLAAAAVVLVSALVLWMQMVPKHESAFASFRITPDSIYELTHASGGKHPAGNIMAVDSHLVINHGAVELKLPHEVRALIEGPASLSLHDQRTVQLDYGHAFFEIGSKEGRGFTVISPHQRIVDLGTAFGVDVKPNREEVELHVFQGKVRVDSPGGVKGDVFAAPRSVLLSGALVEEELERASADFRRDLPEKVETLLQEDFESGLLAGREYEVVMDSTVVRDLSDNRFAGIGGEHPWSFDTARLLLEPASFHDLGGQPSPGHITTRRTNVNLVQFEDGADTGINMRISGAIHVHSGKPGETMPPAAGTPAAALFLASGVDLTDGYLTERVPKESGPTEFIFTGMNPGLRYDIALYGDRSGVPSDGKERFTLKSADGAANRSSIGIVSTFVTEMETRRNAATGHVVRWTDVDPGADGTVTIMIDPSVSGPANRSYLSAVRVAACSVDGVPVHFNGLPFDASGFSDSDGIPDSFELANTNPPSATALGPAGDPDADGLVNLREFQHGTDPYNPDTNGDGTRDGAELAAADVPKDPDHRSTGTVDNQAPEILFRYPADGSSSALPGEQLTITFSEPIKLGTGRIILDNLTDSTETVIAAGGPRVSVDGRVLTVVPPADLADGEVQLGRVHGWESHHGPGIFNPSGQGNWYDHEGLRDESKSRGVIGSMRGPNMATFGECLPGSCIRRDIGRIAPSNRYAVSAAIGVRAAGNGSEEVFDGVTIRLVSLGKLLAEFSADSPPGPPNSVTNVGFSWNSSSLSEGVSADDPLAIEIAPNQASGDSPGYLDLDNVRVTTMAMGDEHPVSR